MGLYGRVLHSKRGYCAATRVIAQVPVPVVGGDSVIGSCPGCEERKSMISRFDDRWVH